MIHQHRSRRRKGASLAESALVLTGFLIIVLGMMDLGLGLLRYHTMSEAARQGARHAIVHGSLAPAASGTWTGPWGPTAIPATAADDNTYPLVQSVRPYLVGAKLSETYVSATWPDGNNKAESRVQVTVSTTYTPMTTFVFQSSFTFSATSTMRITH